MSSTSSSSSSFQGEPQDSHVTYYSEFRNVNDINNPIIDNDVGMQYLGFLKKDWDAEGFHFDAFGYGLSKTVANSGAIFCNDASRLFSMESGYVQMVLSLPHEIIDGVYYLASNTTLDIDDYILWGSNVGDIETCPPGFFAALTPYGIQFTIKNSSTTYTITDITTNIDANTDFTIEFLWQSHNNYITIEIKIDGVVTASGVCRTANDDISRSNFYALDTTKRQSNLECIIRKLLIKNVISSSLFSGSSSSYSESQSSESSSHYYPMSVAIPFVIEGVDNYIPQIEVDFCIVSRKKVNFTAIGPNMNIIKDVGMDTGKYNYANSAPTTPLVLPPGFTELYKNQ